MYCPNCKQEFDGKFCPECGTKLIEKTQRVCPNCNIEVESKFCPECGAKTVEVVEKMVKMCPNCKIETESKFCPECGAKIVEMAVKTTVTGEAVAAGDKKKSSKSANAEAAVENDVVACYNTAMEYHLGINGKKQNGKKAAEWYLKAAEMGLAEAQVQLAGCYRRGWGVESDIDLAFEWYHKAAEQGNGWAQYALGDLYNQPFKGHPRDEKERVKWYKKAFAQGIRELPGLPEPLSPEAMAKAAELQAADCKVAVEKKSKATANKAEDAESCYRTAEDYYYGNNGKPEDEEKAVKWYLKAAEQGHAKAQYMLGECYFAGRGVDEDEDEATEWYLKAAEQGHAKAQFELGRLYYLADGYDEAAKWYLEAAKQGHAEAQQQIGVFYEYGWGVPSDDDEAEKWYLKAAEQGNAEAQLSLGEFYSKNGNSKEAEKWYRKAAEQGNEEAIEYQKKSLTNMDNKEIFCEIFEQYGSMVISSCFGEDTFKKWLESEVFEETGCMLYQVDDMTLERFNTIAELFITHTDIDVNDRQKLALMVLLYVFLWDDVGYSNLKIEYNGEVLIDKPEDEVFEEYKSYLEKIAEYVPAYEPEDSDDEDWDCDDEWNDDEEDEDWNNDEDDEDIEGYEVKDGIGIIPDETTAIKSEAFKGRKDLISINIPKGVTRIGESAFEDCINLASITIPDSVTEIDDNAINGCTSLENITFPDSLKCISSGLLYCCKNLKNITIPNSITSIGEAAFAQCTSLASIKIPNSVTRIEEAAFAECTSLESIAIPNGVTTIGDCIFHSCTSLKSITLPDSVRSIGEEMCYHCQNVKSIKVPAGKGDYFKELLDDEELAKLVVEIR